MKKSAGRERPRSVLQRKLNRLARGEAPRVLDLFSGCGGISIGFRAAGCRIDAAVELDEHAAATHALNFHRDADPEAVAHQARPRDITHTEPDEVTGDLGLGPADEAFDILVGGPPCQAYTRVGRAKLRQIAEDPRAFKTDPRANLYLRYLHYVKITQPVAILVENVPDALNYGGHELYAIGRIVLIVPNGSPLKADGSLADLGAALADGRLDKFAIANPDHAPYGKRAEEALRHRGLWPAIQSKLVFGENVSQAAQFATSANAQGGIIAYSLALSPKVRALGQFALIPAEWHEPLRQRMALMKTAGAVASEFYAFAKSPPAREIFRRYGFALPGEAASSK